jgi:hypothetical protein
MGSVTFHLTYQAGKLGRNIPRTRRNVHLKNLLLLGGLVALALLALILGAEEATLSVTCGTGLGRLRKETALLHDNFSDSVTLAGGALLGLGLLLATFTLAKTADNVLGAGEFDGLSLVKHL